MNTKEITTKLNEIFLEEQHRIVFWHDPEAEFIETISDLSIADVTLLRMDEIGFFSLKKRLEIDEQNNKFLLYSPQPQPDTNHDWLLDIRLYSRTFRADFESRLSL